MTSRVVHLVVLDAIFTLIALRSRTSNEALAATADALTDHRI
ncbi:hypothetical protein ACFQVD_03285 [Streptosporangium amethystogenes subsp. fukuiense]|uniref:Uncharacterized protein n=2 Tax=Streptosporangiaceae TaxID=2004 RepID=A0ABW2SUK0_9ACTN